MRKLIFLFLFLIPAVALAFNVNFTAPTEYTDGTPLPAANIQGFNIYGSQTKGGPYTLIVNVSRDSTPVSITNLDPGVWYIVATTVDISGNESDFSNEVEKSTLFPNPPAITITYTISGTLQVQ